MYTEMFKSLSEQTELALEPYLKFNKLLTKNAEELTELQLAAVRAYSDLGISQLKAMNEVKDPQSFTSFSSMQHKALTEFAQQLTNDSKKITAAAQSFKADVEELVSDSAKQTTTGA